MQCSGRGKIEGTPREILGIQISPLFPFSLLSLKITQQPSAQLAYESTKISESPVVVTEAGRAVVTPPERCGCSTFILHAISMWDTTLPDGCSAHVRIQVDAESHRVHGDRGRAVTSVWKIPESELPAAEFMPSMVTALEHFPTLLHLLGRLISSLTDFMYTPLLLGAPGKLFQWGQASSWQSLGCGLCLRSALGEGWHLGKGPCVR